ncbi:MAG: STAS domain-containing protein [Novosphingobium sp.]
MKGSELSWQVASHPGVHAVVPSGRVDETTASEFGERLVAEVADAAAVGARRMTVDLSQIAYMSSRGLRALTLAQRNAKERDLVIVLAAPSAVMREILAISRYDMVFKVFDRIEDALVL